MTEAAATGDGGAHERRLIGLIGFGAIGREVARILAVSGRYRLAILLRPGSASVHDLPADVDRPGSLAELLALAPALVVEAAGAQAFREFAPGLLSTGVDLIAASTGALGDPSTLADLVARAEASGARLVVPAGAIGGLDYLAALQGVEDVAVVYTSRKPPAAWIAELHAMGVTDGRIATAVTLFEGGAAEAARLYPRNLNAGLTVALAAGLSRTRVRVVADPIIVLNTHEIEVESAAGNGFFRFANRPSPSNPKTSALTGLSLAAAVRRHFEPLVI